MPEPQQPKFKDTTVVSLDVRSPLPEPVPAPSADHIEPWRRVLLRLEAEARGEAVSESTNSLKKTKIGENKNGVNPRL